MAVTSNLLLTLVARGFPFFLQLGAVTLPIVVAISYSRGAFDIRSTVAVLSLLGIVVLTGSFVRRICRLAFGGASEFAIDFLIGYVVVSIALLFGTLAFRLDTGEVFVGVAIVDLLATLYCAFFLRSPPRALDFRRNSIELLFVAGISCVWSQAAISSVPTLEQIGEFAAWRDFFIHAGILVQFSHFESLGGSSIFLAGAKMPFYHFGTYMLPAALHGLAALPALTIATTFFVVLGFVCMGLGSLVLGAVLAGRQGAIAAVLSILFVPDPSHYGLKCPWFGFHWMQQVTPASPYAVSAALFALACFVRASRLSDTKMFGAAIFYALSCLVLRAHVFVVVGLTGMFLFFATLRAKMPLLRYGFIPVAIAVFLLIAFLAESLPTAPHFYSGTFTPKENLKFLLSGSAIRDIDSILVGLPGILQIVVLIFLVIIGLGGIFTFVYALGVAALARFSLLRQTDLIPLYITLSYIIVVVTFPLTDTPDPRELQQRPFVIVYAVLAIWSATILIRLAVLIPARRMVATAASAACILLVCAPFRYAPRVQYGMLSWAPQFIPFSVPTTLVTAARTIRDASPRDSVVWGTAVDDWAVVVGLSERSAFTSLTERTGGAIFLPGASINLLRQREALRPLFASVKSEQELVTLAQRHKISYYIAAPNQKMDASSSSSQDNGAYRILSIPQGSQ